MSNSQRVNIQYSIKEEELPNEINRLVRRAVDLQHNIAQKASELDTRDPNLLWSMQYVNAIQKWRDDLTEADRTLHDIEHLIKSYLRHMSTEEKTAAEPATQDSPLPPLPQLDELNTLIEQFQSQQTAVPEEANEVSPQADS
tara:strand:- start:430 stop:855 length:426 start_codon:yes stop_codon:yes gene_type:complete